MGASARKTDGPSMAAIAALIGRLLRVGVLTSAAVVLVGAAVYLARNGAARPHYGVFRGEPGALRSVSGIVADAFCLNGRGIIQLGLLLLVATPIARVALSVAAFAAERDRLYVVVTLLVLSLLLYSLLWSN
jgi:uncharacterized membrane protein